MVLPGRKYIYLCSNNIRTRKIQRSSLDELRSELMKCLGTSQEAKRLQLLEREVMSDRKPSQFLRDLRSLGGQALTDDMTRGIRMSRLSMTIRAVLVSPASGA